MVFAKNRKITKASLLSNQDKICFWYKTLELFCTFAKYRGNVKTRVLRDGDKILFRYKTF